jgi:hypothetical protein
MAFSVHFAVDLTRVPVEARGEIARIVQQIAEVVATISPANAFWASMKDSVLQIDIAGHRLVYRIDPLEREVRVVELQKLKRS